MPIEIRLMGVRLSGLESTEESAYSKGGKKSTIS